MTQNVILCTVDALGAGHTSTLGYERETTPQLSALAEEGLLYSTCIAQSSHTRESMPSLFYSAYPFTLGDVGPVPSNRPMISTELSDAGFTTAGFHSNPYLSQAYNFDRGFDVFYDSLPLAENRLMTFVHRVLNHFRLQPYTRADELNEKGLQWLSETTAERRFLWLHYMDPHGPYQPPERFQSQFRESTVGQRRAKRLWRRTVDSPESITPEERETLVDLYDAEIRFTDAMIGQFVDELRNRNLFEDTLLVVAADHGDAFGTHDIYGHPRHLYEELIHVPLLVIGPDVPQGETIERPVENIDIGPTILDAVGQSVPSEFAGTSLPMETPSSSGNRESDDFSPVVFAQVHGEDDSASVRRFAARTPRYKYHFEQSDSERSAELYDLERDPGERNDVSDDRSDVRQRLDPRLREHIDATEERTIDVTDDGDVDSVVEDRLENLGYK